MGGRPEHRVRFVREVVAAARTLVAPDFPIGIRVGVDGDGLRRGLTVAELAELCGLMADDVAWFSVSGGNYAGIGDGVETAYVSPWYREPAFNAEAAAAVRAAVDVPVIVTGRIADVALAESLLAEGAADMVGMVRALIADPELPRKAQEGRAGEIRMCLGMSECHAIGPHRVPVTCAVNAAAAREDELEIVPAREPRSVVVVGAGPGRHGGGPGGGPTRPPGAPRRRAAAPSAARRPCWPSTRTVATSGTTPPGSRASCAGRGSSCVLGNVVAADELVEFGADVVVVATGGVPLVPDVPGIGGPDVVTALDVLRGATTRDRAVVVGGLEAHLGPPTVAELLADRGVEVELLSEHFDFARGVEDGTRFPLRARRPPRGSRSRCVHRLVRVDPAGPVVEDSLTGRSAWSRAPPSCWRAGMLPDDRLARELEGRVPEVHVIGDALAPRRIMHATLEGARAAVAL